MAGGYKARAVGFRGMLIETPFSRSSIAILEDKSRYDQIILTLFSARVTVRPLSLRIPLFHAAQKGLKLILTYYLFSIDLPRLVGKEPGDFLSKKLVQCF
jgi:hypothetical protein